MKKRMIALLTAVLMLLSVMPVAAFAENGELTFEGNLLKVTTVDDFNAGTLTGLEIDAAAGNGAIVLSEGETQGTFVSAVYNVTAFTKMVASWSASIYDGTSVEIWAQARQDGQWTGWMSWGPYSPYISRGSGSNKSCPTASLDTDIFAMDSGTADALQLMAVVKRSSADVESPQLRQISMTLAGGDVSPVYAEDRIETLPNSVLNEAPAYAQGIRHPSIGGSICSPTTMSVMLNSRDASLDLFPEEIALNVKDEGEGIFGNWSFTASGAGLYGYECYAQYANLDILLQELAHGRTVGCSVSYSPDPSSSYPYLEGSYGGTGGHLITIIGYEYESGIQDEEHLYLYSSDSYSKDDATSYHRYKWTQFTNAWSGRLAYIVPALQAEEGAAITGVTRVLADLQVSDSDRTLFTFVDEDGNALDMARFVSGGGLLGYTVEGFAYDELQATDASVLYDNRIQVTANNIFYYNISCTDDGQVKLNTNTVLENLGIAYGEERDITVYAFSDRGYLYIATLEDATIQADEVVVLPETACTGASVESRVYTGENRVESSLTVNDLEGDKIAVGLLIPENAVLPEDADIYTSAEGAQYLSASIPADKAACTLYVDWFNNGVDRRYDFDLAGVTLVSEIVEIEGNVVSVDLENGRASGKLELRNDGSLALAKGETYGEYYSPVYDSFDWEYAMACLNAYLPGTSSVDMQIRAYTEKGQAWSDWYSFGKQGVGSSSTSISMKDDYVNMGTDVFSIRGSSSVANAQRFQVRFVLRGDGKAQPAVYHGEITYKKSSYDPSEAAYIGETAVADLPAAAGKDLHAYSAYAYNWGSNRFDNMELMMLNTQGADLLFEEVALVSYDQDSGWGNWTMTNYKPGAFGYRAYSQYGANATLIQQAIADGNIVGVYVHGGRLPSTNSSSSSQTVVYAYYTAEDGTVMFKVCCPRGDTSELNRSDVFGEVSAADLNYAIQGFSTASARGIMYVVGEKEYASSWTRVTAKAVAAEDHDSFQLTVKGDALNLPATLLDDETDFGNGAIITYTLDSETDPEAKLAAGEFYYDITINADGTLAIPEDLKAALLNNDSAQVYVVRNDGITYTAALTHTHLWDEGVTTKQPTVEIRGEITYTCSVCGGTDIEYIPCLLPVPVGPAPSTPATPVEPEQPVQPEEPTPAEPALPFTDVGDAWYTESVAFVYENGIMTGVSADSFAPTATTTRGMIVTMLARMEGVDTSASQPWYEAGRQWSVENGISDGTDMPGVITREQLVTMLYRYAQQKGYDVSVGADLTSFADAEAVSAWAQDAMQWAVSVGLIQGNNGQLNPTGSASRAETAAILARFVGTFAE